MDLHEDDKHSSEPAMLRASWLILNSSATTTTAATTSVMSNGHLKRSAFENGLKQRRTFVGTEDDNVNDKVSLAGDSDCSDQRTGASSQAKNWSSDERKHLAKSDTCLRTTRSHLGQVWMINDAYLSLSHCKFEDNAKAVWHLTSTIYFFFSHWHHNCSGICLAPTFLFMCVPLIQLSNAVASCVCA